MNQRRAQESAAGERESVRISKDFAFPRGVVFDMIANPKKAEAWFGLPEGAEVLLFEWDPKPGGAIRIHGRYEGKVGKTTGTMLEVRPPERVVFRTKTTMEEGEVPFEADQTMLLEELGPNQTRFTALVKVLSPGSFPGGVDDLEEGFRGGWGQTLEKLQRELH